MGDCNVYRASAKTPQIHSKLGILDNYFLHYWIHGKISIKKTYPNSNISQDKYDKYGS